MYYVFRNVSLIFLEFTVQLQMKLFKYKEILRSNYKSCIILLILNIIIIILLTLEVGIQFFVLTIAPVF